MDFFESLLYSISQGITWMTMADYKGITPIMVAFFGLVLSLFWRFIISPLFGIGDARSDRVRDSKKSKSSGEE